MQRKSEYVFLTNTYDDEDKIFALKADVEAICKRCSDCDGEDIEDGCGCLTAFMEICYQQKPIFYGSDLRESTK